MDPLGPSGTALELAAALRRRELSAVELLDACLAAVDQRNGELNAVTWRNDDEARAAAAEADRRLAAGSQAPFLGVPLPIKDLTPVAGWPVTYGSHGAPAGASEESELVVDSLLAAGFVLCDRTNTPEFGLITAAENSRHGITRNPWDTSRSPGGSSRRRRCRGRAETCPRQRPPLRLRSIRPGSGSCPRGCVLSRGGCSRRL